MQRSGGRRSWAARCSSGEHCEDDVLKSIPAVDVVIDAALNAARRFPLVLMAGVMAAVAACVEASTHGESDWATRMLVAASLGLPLLFATASLAELRAWPHARAWLLHGAALLTLALVAWQWPEWTDAARFTRYALLSASFHLSAAFLANITRHEPQGFWQFNRVLFIRALTTALYSAVLFAGLAAALAAIDVLFKVGISPQRYGQLMSLVAFGFATWFFTAGIPDPLTQLDTDTSYPDGLRKFAQYLLIPLVVIYLLILTTYLGRVVITREWPSGWIGNLVSSVSIAGMLAWLLVRPLEDKPEYAWVLRYTRGFYIALLPSIAMLWMALAKRIGQYGLTERRTIAAAGALWLTGIALYYIASRSRNIKLIPVSLCAVTVLLSAGPLSAFSLSRENQLARLEARLVRTQLLRNGKLVRAVRVPADSDVAAIGDAVYYLRLTHGAKVFYPWLSDSLRTALEQAPRDASNFSLIEGEADMVVGTMGIPMQRHTSVQTGQQRGEKTINFASRSIDAIEVDGFQWSAPVNAFRTWHDTVRVGQAELRISPDSTQLQLTRAGHALVVIPVDTLVALATQIRPSDWKQDSAGVSVVPKANGMRTEPPVVYTVRGDSARARLVLSNLMALQRGPHWLLQEFSGTLLVDFGPAPRRP